MWVEGIFTAGRPVGISRLKGPWESQKCRVGYKGCGVMRKLRTPEKGELRY